jgi:tetratricopeptide (TPR) repeat protein
MPMFRRALNLYGGALGTMGRLDEALEVLQRALRLNEELAEKPSFGKR